ncbi:12500_t:CDS:2, partial [Ambispora leptoticha]
QISITSPTQNQQYVIGSTIPIAGKVQYEGLAYLENITLQTLDGDTGEVIDDNFYNTTRQDLDDDRAFSTTLFLDPEIYVPKGHQLDNDDVATGIYTIHAIGDCTYFNVTIGEKQRMQIFDDVKFMIVNDTNLSRDVFRSYNSATENLSSNSHRRRWMRHRLRSLFKI